MPVLNYRFPPRKILHHPKHGDYLEYRRPMFTAEKNKQQRYYREWLKSEFPVYKNLNIWAMRYMEESCKLWDFALRKKAASDAGDHDEINYILHTYEYPVRQRTIEYWKIMWMLRQNFLGLAICTSETILKNTEKLMHPEKGLEFFFDWFAWTQDPRMQEIITPDSPRLSTTLPFILFPQQRQILQDIEMWYRNRLSGAIEKSREEGISWLICAWVVYHFLFTPGFVAIMGSQKEEKVDVVGSVDPLFGKIRHILYRIPKPFRPEGLWSKDNPYDSQRKLINPQTKGEIKGEIGDNIGRSGRANVVVIDEVQDIEHFDLVNKSISSTANCKIFIGTIKGMNHFYQMITSGKVSVSRIRWYQDPRKCPTWRDNKPNMDCSWRKYLEATEDPVVIAQEYDADPNASVDGSMIPSEWVQMCIAWLDMPTDANSDVVGGFDVATGRGTNEALYICRVGVVACNPYSVPFHTSTECTWAVVDRGIEDGIRLLNYDEDGIGESLVGLLQTTDRPIPYMINGLHGNDRASDMIMEDGRKGHEKFRNKRAERWWALRQRCKRTYEHRKGIQFYPTEELISIPNDPQLITQLSQPMIKYLGGRIAVESKDDMKRRGVKSPDRADALVYAFSDIDASANIVSRMDYTKGKAITNFTLDYEKMRGDQYVSLYLSKDGVTHVVCCYWSSSVADRCLYVYDEIVEAGAEPRSIVERVQEKMRSGIAHIKEWIGNDVFFEGMGQGIDCPFYLYRKAGITLRQNHTNSEVTSISIMNRMFELGMIRVHKNCVNTFNQTREWKRNKQGSIDRSRGCSMAILQMVNRLHVKKVVTESDIKKYYNKFDLMKVA